MRLKSHEVQAIISVFQPILSRSNGRLFLFGSRVDDAKKGGDIDLLLVVPQASIDLIKSDKIKLINSLQMLIGEQRIDVTVASPESMKSDPFLLSISESLVSLI